MAGNNLDKIDPTELINLSKRIDPSYYRSLGNILGFEQAVLDHIRAQAQLDMLEATHTVLRRWYDRQPSVKKSRDVLADLLTEVELKAQGDLLRSGDKCLLQGSPKRVPNGRESSSSSHIPIAPSAPSTRASPSQSFSLAGLVDVVGSLLPQHNSHVYNASSDTIKIVLTSRNEETTHVLNPRNHCCIKTPYGRVRLDVYRKAADRDGRAWAGTVAATYTDYSDRSFIVKPGQDGENLVVVRSKYGGNITQEDRG